jgi:hypothetical protein
VPTAGSSSRRRRGGPAGNEGKADIGSRITEGERLWSERDWIGGNGRCLRYSLLSPQPGILLKRFLSFLDGNSFDRCIEGTSELASNHFRKAG